ncbi:MAG: FHA domain-containing protein [Gammaproteobacteria bacterium]
MDGGRIGRAPENDMVLQGVGVHRHHATVRFINGVFFVEGVGTNGIAINDPDRVLPRNEPYPLKTGDRIFIDEYEVAVTASATAPAEPAVREGGREAGRPVAEATDPGARPGASILGNRSESAEDLDPLRKLVGGGTVPPPPQRAVEPAWNHSPSLSDQFTPPAVAQAPAASVIPENWDRTSFDRSKLQPSAPQPAGLQPSGLPPAGSLPLAHSHSSPQQAARGPAASAAAAARAPLSTPAAALAPEPRRSSSAVPPRQLRRRRRSIGRGSCVPPVSIRRACLPKPQQPWRNHAQRRAGPHRSAPRPFRNQDRVPHARHPGEGV